MIYFMGFRYDCVRSSMAERVTQSLLFKKSMTSISYWVDHNVAGAINRLKLRLIAMI